MPLRRPILTAVVCAALASAAVAAQDAPKTADTPAKPTAAAPGPLDAPDLQKRVSLTLKDADINKAVEELAKVAGVSLVVERPASLTLRPMTLVIREARLRDVMDQLGSLYGYRWRRRGDVFLLTIATPRKEDADRAGEEMMKAVEKILSPEQRAKLDASGTLDGKDLSPGQQGILAGFLQEMMMLSLSSNLGIGSINFDREKNSFSISGRSADDSGGVQASGGSKP